MKFIFLSILLFLTACKDRRICCVETPFDFCGDGVTLGEIQSEIKERKEFAKNSTDTYKRNLSNELNRALKCYVNGRLDFVKLLINEGADVNAKVGGKTILMYAAMNGDKEAIDFLIERGADVNAVDNNGKTALQLAEEKFNLGEEERESESEQGKEIINSLKKHDVSSFREYPLQTP